MEYRIVIYLYNYFLQNKGWISTKELFEKVKPNISKRNFYNYLNKMESEGILISKHEGKEKLWRLNESFVHTHTDNDLLGFVIYLLSFFGDNFKEIFSKELQSLLKKFSPEGLKVIANVSRDLVIREVYFKYERKHFEFLTKIVNSFNNKNKVLSVYTKKSGVLKGIPVKVYMKNGFLYLVLHELLTDSVKVIELSEIERLTILEESRNTKVDFNLYDNLFVFGIQFHDTYMHMPQPPTLLFPTQFYYERRNNYHTYYLIGSTSDNFSQVFLSILYDRIIPPEPRMLIKAREIGLDKKYKSLPVHDINENVKRFLIFLENLEKHVDLRNAIIKGLKAQLQSSE